MFEWLNTFKIVYETRNFSLAAKRLFISQPTVSLQIQKLEKNLNVKLFYRNGKQFINTTQEADYLYPKVVSILDNLNTSLSKVSNKENFKTNCIISCSNTTAIHLVPKIMPKLLVEFPLVNFNIQMKNTNNVIESIQRNESHIGFLERDIDAKDISKTIIYQDELVLAGPKESEIWIMRENNSGLRFFNEIYLFEKNLTPSIVCVDNNDILLELLKNRVGKSIVSKLMVNELVEWEEIEKKYNTRDFLLIKNTNNHNDELLNIYNYIQSIDIVQLINKN
ncbi:LysR family transcriptional regulator [Vagococcus fluvialis]|uniref:LysR family transcriptional regulator n=1 Tax=Vagococcus fluvialis TaxID=2738 RepID=UPI001A8E3B22|nr:LysR family transcriptional regulator [Vagococcus fluvialis]MBO0444706.1 LysR family transcriptional regulator [Vagococcus fluvialis]MDT2747967.1 LysR family transcriptional regulator [Vagococcus fluvialis]UDM73844.1 LysR family transcriptional regulator [Vagococcus fluvialis]